MSIAIQVLFYLTISINALFTIFNAIHPFLFVYSFFLGKRYLTKRQLKRVGKTDFVKYKFAIIIAAKDEENVIKDIVLSLKNQTYDSNLIDIYVVADNCTDKTAEVARQHGAIVLERFNQEKKGANFAIQHAFQHIKNSNKQYDAFCYFDSDNIVDKDWVKFVNNSLNYGNELIVTCRNSSNFTDNWISFSYALQFLIESKYLNLARNRFGLTSFVNGTGFCLTKRVLELTNYWDFNSLSHDIEFSQFLSLNNIKCEYVDEAMFYDEQPIKFKDSYKQRLRWSKGFLQVFKIYNGKELKYLFGYKNKNKTSVWANFVTIFPQVLLILLNIISYIVIASMIPFVGSDLMYWINTPILIIVPLYFYFFIQALIAYCQNHKMIKCSKWKGIGYVFLFPFFMMTYIPISLIAMCKRKVSTDPLKRKKR